MIRYDTLVCQMISISTYVENHFIETNFSQITISPTGSNWRSQWFIHNGDSTKWTFDAIVIRRNYSSMQLFSVQLYKNIDKNCCTKVFVTLSLLKN